jgi:dihydrofolate reductase
LDGVVSSPNKWTGPYWSDEMAQGMEGGLKEADAILIGRNTYVEFTDWWGSRGDSTPMSAFLNNTHKYVVSSTLTEAELKWPEATLISGDFIARINELKSQPGKNIQVPGSPRLVAWLLDNGLLDQLALNIAPVVVGEGYRLFEDISKKIPLKLTRSYTLPHGVLGTDFEPAEA